jgi:putative salt-induced outer membrane protein YdiY
MLFRFLASLLLLASVLNAEDARNWTNQADLGLVATDGNSQSTSVHLKNTLTYKKDKNQFTFKVTGMRVENTEFLYHASGSEDQFILEREERSTISSERYTAKLNASRDWKHGFFLEYGADWEQDKPKGLKERTTVFAGVSRSWKAEARYEFNLGINIAQNWETETSGLEKDYGALRPNYHWKWMLTPSATYDQELDVSVNLEDTDDSYLKWDHALSAHLSKRMALKIALELYYDHQPPLIAVPLVDEESGVDVFVEKENTDYSFTASVVINL